MDVSLPVTEVEVKSVLDASMQLQAPDTCEGSALGAMPQEAFACLLFRRNVSGQNTAVVLRSAFSM